MLATLILMAGAAVAQQQDVPPSVRNLPVTGLGLPAAQSPGWSGPSGEMKPPRRPRPQKPAEEKDDFGKLLDEALDQRAALMVATSAGNAYRTEEAQKAWGAYVASLRGRRLAKVETRVVQVEKGRVVIGLRLSAEKGVTLKSGIVTRVGVTLPVRIDGMPASGGIIYLGESSFPPGTLPELDASTKLTIEAKIVGVTPDEKRPDYISLTLRIDGVTIGK